MGNFLDWSFWFSARPGVFTASSLRLILAINSLFIVLAVVSGVAKKKWAKGLYAAFWSSLYNFFLTNAIIGLLLTFFNYEMLPFLSARFWFLLWGASMLIWLFFIYKIIVRIPQKKAQMEKEKEFKKYIP